MHTNQALFRPTAYFLILTMIVFFLPAPGVQAGMIGTEELITAERVLEARERVETFMQREDVRSELERFGISSEQAQARVDGLTNAEVAQLAGKIEQLPAGGVSGWEVLGIIVIIIIITDLLGVTNILPFIRPVN
jgi:hypothetical protein